MKDTITSSEEISDLFRTARKNVSPNLLVLIATQPEGRDRRGRVAFIAGKRLGNAPGRNRAKRVMRQAARQAGLPRDGYDIALVARTETKDASSQELAGELRRILERTLK
ncbi:MAG: ribonuclease P protein component [Coriobacteriales bacterium]|jgi:ribonuclease P protein component|nr:ribonuclease P protein component [Coriobacteriales bacterium]